MNTSNDQGAQFLYLVMCVTRATGVPSDDILGKRRKRHMAEARHMLRALATRFFPMFSQERIGIITGDCDRTTVIHSLRKHGDLYYTDPDYRQAYNIAVSLAGMRLRDGGEGSSRAVAPPTEELTITVNYTGEWQRD